MRIELFLIPGPVEQERLSGKSLVIIDVLRASTTICQSLSAGARAVIPVETSGEAAELRTKIGIENAILGGERKGMKIDDFDLGNSPFEYTTDRIMEKTVILTTSNGTKFYSRAAQSNPIITGGLVNISAVAGRVARESKDLVIICAGNEGDFSIEDTLCGGMLIDKIINVERMRVELNDAGALALLLYNSNRDSLEEAIAGGMHGRYLKGIGFGDDVVMASKADSIPVLPILHDSRIILEKE